VSAGGDAVGAVTDPWAASRCRECESNLISIELVALSTRADDMLSQGYDNSTGRSSMYGQLGRDSHLGITFAVFFLQPPRRLRARPPRPQLSGASQWKRESQNGIGNELASPARPGLWVRA
jgi:hypothetical protein